MTARATLDIADLPDHGFGSRSIMWWATVCIIAIEATVFVVTRFVDSGEPLRWPGIDHCQCAAGHGDQPEA